MLSDLHGKVCAMDEASRATAFGEPAPQVWLADEQVGPDALAAAEAPVAAPSADLTAGLAAAAGVDPEFSRVVVHLLKGVLYRETHEKLWHALLQQRAAVRDHLAVMSLTVIVDDAEGYAYCRSLPDDDEGRPRLVPRRRLSFHVSLLLALLRKRLAEIDATGESTRLILTREQIGQLLLVFLPAGSNEVRNAGLVDSTIEKVRDLGFLREVRGQSHTYEVARVLKAFVDAQWLGELDARLAEYAASVTKETA